MEDFKMAPSPDDMSDTSILRLSGDLPALNPETIANGRANQLWPDGPTLPRSTEECRTGLRITFAGYIPVWWLNRMLAEAGITLRNGLSDGGLRAELTPEAYANLQAETNAAVASHDFTARQALLEQGMEP